MLALAGCGSSSDDSTSDTPDTPDTPDTAACTTSETIKTEHTSLPQITYTEVDEGSAANDSRETAQSISASNTILTGNGSYQFPGAGCVDCDDYFSLVVTEGDELEFELSTPDGMTAFIFIYEGDATNTNIYSDSGDSVKRLEHTVSSGVTSLIIYVNTYQGTGDYTLKVSSPVEPVTITQTTSAECLANLTGEISNAVSGALITGATVNLREGEGAKTGDVDYTTTTNSLGEYDFTDVDAGDYTLEIIKSDFITHYLDITLAGEKTTEKKFQISPTLAQGQVLRAVMSWGASPNILDSYLHGPTSSSGTFTVKYYNRSGGGATLDRDATKGYGPETITFTELNEGTYTYWINDYSNGSGNSSTTSTKLAESGANVTVYDSSGIIKQYKVPVGGGTKWNVFTITVDSAGAYTINDVNTLSGWSESP